MALRIDHKQASPGAFQAMLALEKHAHQADIDPARLELMKTCVSQINGWNRLAVAFGSVAVSFELPKA
jgi:hypothetical protein